MKIFRDISNYSKKRKLLLVEAIEKINWDTNYNPQEFLALLTGSQADKKWALTKMLAYMPYIRVRQLLTKEFLRESVTEEMIDTIYPPMRREEIFRVYHICLNKNIIKRKIMKDRKNINLNGDIYGIGVVNGGTINQDIHLQSNHLGSFGHALYYPKIHLTDEEWLKHAFLFWDKISRIVPNKFEPEDSDNVRQIQQETNFLENYYPKQGLIRSIMRDFGHALLDSSKKVIKHTDSPTYIHLNKIDPFLINKLQKLGLAEEGRGRWSGWLRIDNEIGDLYMSYLAQEISSEISVPIITDNTIIYNSKKRIKSRHRNSFEEKLGYLLIDTIIPKNINSVSISELINIRTKYNDERVVFFDEINKLSTTLSSIDNQSALQDALHHYKTSLNKQTKDLEKIFNLNGIDTIKNPLAISIGASLVTDSLWGISAGLAYGAISSYTEYERKKIERNSHPMSYLLNIKSELNKENLFQKIKNVYQPYI